MHGTALLLRGKWYLMDVTWASLLYANEDSSDQFFLSPPEEFIFTHYPEDPKWTLLDRVYSYEEFENFPIIKDYFLFFNIVPPEKGKLSTNKEYLQIDINLPEKGNKVSFELVNINNGKVFYPDVQILRNNTNTNYLKLKVPDRGQYYFRVLKSHAIGNNLYEDKNLITFYNNRL